LDPGGGRAKKGKEGEGRISLISPRGHSRRFKGIEMRREEAPNDSYNRVLETTEESGERKRV